MSSISFHLCTVPDVEAGRRLYGFRGLDDGDVVKAMEHIGRQSGNASNWAVALQRVVAVSVLLSNEDGFELHSLGAPGGDEKALLEDCFALLGRETDVLVSWNGSETMLPVLNVRALLHGIVAPDYWQRSDDWDLNVDLSAYLLGNAAAGTMDQVASLLGLPLGGSLSTDQIQDAWAAGDLSRVQDWCDQQALNTQFIYLRFQLINGDLSARDYQARMDLFQQELKRWGNESPSVDVEARNG